jgi:hypothetical protein
MKKILFPLLGIALAFSFTGKRVLPPTIAAGLNARYPNAKIKSWEMANDQYRIKITTDRNKEVAFFSTDGKWLRTEKHLALTKDLPPAVKRGFRQSGYAAWKIDKISEVSAPDEPLRYVLDVDDGNQLDSWHYDAFKEEFLLYFDRDGVIIKKTGS